MHQHQINGYETETIIVQVNVDYCLQMVKVDCEIYTHFYDIFCWP